jgi:hypothetical protein
MDATIELAAILRDATLRVAPQDEAGDTFAARLARKHNLESGTATKQPAGQITQILSSPDAKNIPLNSRRKSAF